MISHYSCTLENETGKRRRERNLSKWQAVGIPPEYVFGFNQKSSRHYSGHKNEIARAQFGCHQTHLFAWQHFLNSGSVYALITEDDAFPLNDCDLIQEISKLVVSEEFKESPCLIQLGHVIFSKFSFSILFISILKLIKNFKILRRGYTSSLSFGTHAYLINRAMAEFLVQFEPNGMLGLDILLINLSKSELGANIGFQKKVIPLVRQERIDSSIPTNQEYFGNLSGKLNLSEIISCVAES